VWLGCLLGVAGFLGLSVVSIPSLRQAGLWLAVGLLSNAAAAFALLPSILAWEARRGIVAARTEDQTRASLLPWWHPLANPWGAGIAAVAILVAILPATRLEFRSDLSSYRVQASLLDGVRESLGRLLTVGEERHNGWSNDIGYGIAMGRIATMPAILATSGQDAPRMPSDLEGFHGALNTSILEPREDDRRARLEVVGLARDLEASPILDTLLAGARSATQMPPRWVRLLGDPSEGTRTSLVLQVVASLEAEHLLRIRESLRSFLAAEEETVVSPWFVHAQTVDGIPGQAAKAALASVLLVACVLLLGGRASRRLFLGSMVVLLGIAVLVGAGMWGLGVPLDLYGLLALPSLIAVSVDASIHVGHSALERDATPEGTRRLRERLATASWGVLLNALGFAWLPLSAHPGMQGLGFLAMGGAFVSWILLWTLLPWVHWRAGTSSGARTGIVA
jgi:hypothetical protein